MTGTGCATTRDYLFQSVITGMRVVADNVVKLGGEGGVILAPQPKCRKNRMGNYDRTVRKLVLLSERRELTLPWPPWP